MDNDKKIAKAKVKILLEHPFFATGILQLDIQNDETGTVDIASIDPYGRVRLNPAFIKELSIDEISYLLCHELLHVVLLHLLRRGERNAQLWGIAADMAVDAFLARSGFKVFHNLNEKYPPPKEGMCAEELYAWLVKEFKQKVLQEPGFDTHIEMRRGQEQSQTDGKGQKDKDKKENGEKKDASQKDENKEKSGQGSAQGDKEQGSNKDKNAQGNKGSNQGKEKEPNDKEGDGQDSGIMSSDTLKYQAELDAQERAKLEEKWKGVLINMMNSARMRGNLPGWLEEIVQELIEPPLPWHIILQQFIQSKRKCGSSWLPPNKKYLAHNIYLPSFYEDFVKLGIVIDTSGSIGSNELKLFFGALNGILGSLRNYELLVLQSDTRVTDERTFYTGEILDLRDFSIKGRGGTDFRSAFNRLNEEAELDGVIFLTDGDGTYPEEAPNYPVLWLLVEDYNAPFGDKINMRK